MCIASSVHGFDPGPDGSGQVFFAIIRENVGAFYQMGTVLVCNVLHVGQYNSPMAFGVAGIFMESIQFQFQSLGHGCAGFVVLVIVKDILAEKNITVDDDTLKAYIKSEVAKLRLVRGDEIGNKE